MTSRLAQRPRCPRRTLAPAIEGMEPRLLMTTSGGRWSQQALITYSIAPDGTSIGGIPSGLQSTLNARFSLDTWRAAIKRAAATWQAVVNINLAEVPDSGLPFSTAGYQQGDSRFGDIRIGGVPGAPSNLATAFLPPAFNGGTLAGDIVFNTNQAWQINNDYDLQTVAIHEFGHALGLDHSSITLADMYASYNGMKPSLHSDDTTSIQAVYGQRTADTNNSYQNADILNLDGLGQGTWTGRDIASSTDADWIRVTAPLLSIGTMRVTMQSTGLSSLAPKVLVYNGALIGVASAASTVLGATVTTTVLNILPGQVYFIKAMAAAGGISGTGAYGVQVNFGSSVMLPIGSPITPVPSQPDQGGGSTSQTVNWVTGEVVTESGGGGTGTPGQAAKPTGRSGGTASTTLVSTEPDVDPGSQVRIAIGSLVGVAGLDTTEHSHRASRKHAGEKHGDHDKSIALPDGATKRQGQHRAQQPRHKAFHRLLDRRGRG